jgi:endonuclease/exonuclease/phosphatase family metal-dependent hydrolase
VLTLDRIWVRPLAGLRHVSVHASSSARRASDHLPVIAEIEL